MKKKLFKLSLTAIGVALYFVFSKFVVIPSWIPNINFSLQFGILTILAYCLGPIEGFIIGFFGHLLTDVVAGYGIWIFWVIASGIYGLSIGLISILLKKKDFKFTSYIILFFTIILTMAFCFGLITPIGDYLFYGEPKELLVTQALFTIISNSSSAILLSLPLIKTIYKEYSKHID